MSTFRAPQVILFSEDLPRAVAFYTRLVVSSLAIHNIPIAAGRPAAIDEAVRVLRPGGRIVIADLGFTGKYVSRLRSLGLTDTRRRNLGWRVWWGGPWFPTRLVTARSKPAVTTPHETAAG